MSVSNQKVVGLVGLCFTPLQVLEIMIRTICEFLELYIGLSIELIITNSRGRHPFAKESLYHTIRISRLSGRSQGMPRFIWALIKERLFQYEFFF